MSTHRTQPILIGIIIGLITGLLAYYWRGTPGDLGSGLCLAQAIRSGATDFYTVCPSDPGLPQDTIFAGILMLLPLALLPASLIGALWTALTSGLLAWALTREGAYWRLLILLTPAYWMTLWNIQAGPLLLLIALFPNWLPLAFYKPLMGLAIGLWRFSWKRALACALVLAVSLALWPHWLLAWLDQSRAYQFVIPLLVLPVGPLLALALWRWQSDRARLLLIMSIIPQRSMYNAMLVYLIPATIREMAGAVIGAWLGFIVWAVTGMETLGWVVGCYLPMLAIVLLNGDREP